MFKDHFSKNSAGYGRYRPHYPEELFAHLAAIAPGHDRAWDCACGTGQAAMGLRGHFREVVATDASASQINKAEPCPGISYRVARAEDSELGAATINLITVAQALHWFDLPAFFQEAERVLHDNGVLAAWTYNLFSVNPAVDAVVDRLYAGALAPYWPAERGMVENGYRDIPFPFAAVVAPHFAMQEKWDFSQLIGYIETWSAVTAYRKSENPSALAAMFAEIGRAWGDTAARCTVTWPLTLIIRRKVTSS
ncbi:MAG: class I SAM-dependent methyltransferase [Thermodesulfobacteriota bacterium]